VREDAVGADFRRSADEADVEDEREDGNLIEGEGIFLGKGRDGGSNIWRCRLRSYRNLEVEL
jgi:hypothetical protein